MEAHVSLESQRFPARDLPKGECSQFSMTSNRSFAQRFTGIGAIRKSISLEQFPESDSNALDDSSKN